LLLEEERTSPFPTLPLYPTSSHLRAPPPSQSTFKKPSSPSRLAAATSKTSTDRTKTLRAVNVRSASTTSQVGWWCVSALPSIPLLVSDFFSLPSCRPSADTLPARIASSSGTLNIRTAHFARRSFRQPLTSRPFECVSFSFLSALSLFSIYFNPFNLFSFDNSLLPCTDVPSLDSTVLKPSIPTRRSKNGRRRRRRLGRWQRRRSKRRRSRKPSATPTTSIRRSRCWTRLSSIVSAVFRPPLHSRPSPTASFSISSSSADVTRRRRSSSSRRGRRHSSC
jgi:hypothetical protein